MRTFVQQVYIPDVLLVASAYPEWTKHRRRDQELPHLRRVRHGPDRRHGVVPVPARDHPRPGSDAPCSRSIRQRSPSRWRARGTATTEGDQAALHPYKGETNANYTGPEPPYQWLYTDRKYSWLKAPRYDGQVMEVGPLARALVAYAAGVPAVKQSVDATLKKLGAKPAALYSTLGRVAARALESEIVMSRLEGWLDQLERNMNSGDTRIADTAKWDALELALERARIRAARGPARRARPLGRDPERHDLALPGGCPDDLERLPARRRGAAGPV